MCRKVSRHDENAYAPSKLSHLDLVITAVLVVEAEKLS